MFYVYVLQMQNQTLYIGFTSDLKKRLQEHNKGQSIYTKKFLPARLIYYECYLSDKDAKKRESMLKEFGSTYSHLKKRISASLGDSQGRD
ncbi:GIY-YIG nuclease family protein [Candidatus Parcubacteria bacterium]|nr:GIY-YIG nuclease family protein [Candidatus Parcubacteria bacterium]